MKIMIVGCGKVGTALTEQLSKENHDITVVDVDASLVHRVSNTYDVLGIIGNGASYSILTEADIINTELLIAVTAFDELNLLCCVIAKKAGNCQTIARIKNPIYNQELDFLKKELGLSMIINQDFASAMEISRLLRFPTAIEIDTFVKGRVELLKFRIPKNSILHNKSLKTLSSSFRCEVLVCAVERSGEVVIPTGDFTLMEKDLVSIIATPANASAFFKKIGIITNQVKNSLIVGGSPTAYYLAKILITTGIQVKIIERDQKRCEELCALLPQAVIIHGDGSDQHLLTEERIDFMESFVALTGIDEENIMMSLYAMNYIKSKVVTKINRPNFDTIIKKLDLDSVVNPRNITSENILQYVRARQNTAGSNVETLYKLIDGRVEALEFHIHSESEIINIPLEHLKIKKDFLIAAIGRKGKILIPNGQDVLLADDTVVVVTTYSGLQDIKTIISK